jgi:protein-disulfide isomerase
MSETSTNSSGSSNTVIYAACVIAGIVLGVLGSMAITGNKGGGGSDPVVAEYNGKSVRGSEAFGQIKSQLFELEEQLFRTKEQAVNDYIEQRILDAEAKKAGVTMEQLLDKEAGGGAAAEVTDKDVEAFLSSKGLSLNDPRIKKDDVREYLKYRQRFEKRQAYVSKLREGAKVKLFFYEPESPKLAVTTDGYPTWGNANAPVTIVEFSDYQCPYCSRAVPVLEQVKKEYGPEKVRIVFRDMPLPNHPRAAPASLAAHCANDQGKFWEMHNLLFENQQKLEDKDLKGYAAKLSLDATKFNDCFTQKKHQALIDKSKVEAEKVGISATPSFVINGTLLQGAQPFPRFKEKIDRGLKKG